MKKGFAAFLAAAAALVPLARAAAPAVSSGNHHSVALHADGTVRTWGDDSTGQLGLGRRSSRPRPPRCSASPTFRA
jgi:Alpha-tubulin suppressor and related RCC1 domain-containing proteins